MAGAFQTSVMKVLMKEYGIGFRARSPLIYW